MYRQHTTLEIQENLYPIHGPFKLEKTTKCRKCSHNLPHEDSNIENHLEIEQFCT